MAGWEGAKQSWPREHGGISLGIGINIYPVILAPFDFQLPLYGMEGIWDEADDLHVVGRYHISLGNVFMFAKSKCNVLRDEFPWFRSVSSVNKIRANPPGLLKIHREKQFWRKVDPVV